MNGYQRIAAAFAGERPDHVPVILHNFMMAAREAGHVFSRWRRNPEMIAGSFIQAVETYGFDGVLVDLDTATLAGALGVPVEQPEDEPALAHGARLGELTEVERLEPVNVDADPRVQVAMHRTCRRFLDSLAQHTVSMPSLPHLARAPRCTMLSAVRYEPR